MTPFTLTAGCRWCAGELEHTGTGHASPVQHVAIVACTDCGATFAIRVELVAVGSPTPVSTSPSAVRGRAYRDRKREMEMSCPTS